MLRRCVASVLMMMLMTPSAGLAASPRQAETRPSHIQLNLPEDLELGALVDVVSQQLGMNFIIGDELRGKRITLKAPSRVPQDSLYGVLESALQIQGLVIVDAPQKGWKRIVSSRDLAKISELQSQPTTETRQGVATTRIFTLTHADSRNVEKVIKPFLTDQGANVIAVPEHRLMIVTDFSANQSRIASLIELMDQPRLPVEVRFVPVRHMKVQEVVRQLVELLAAKGKAESFGAESAARGRVDVAAEARSNQLVLIGTADQIIEAEKILAALDQPLELETRSYTMSSISPDRLDRILREMIPPADQDRLYRSTIDRESSLLVVTTTKEHHQKINSLQAKLDQPLAQTQNPVRFYKLQNANAREVLEVIQALEAGDGFASAQMEGTSGSLASDGPGNANPTVPAPTDVGVAGVAEGGSRLGSVDRSMSTAGRQAGKGRSALRRYDLSGKVPGTVPGEIPGEGQASVTADQNTNSIIVVAEPRVQKIYEALIERLDQRRPQVLIEVTLVTIDTSDGFSLGVEVSGRRDDGSTNYLTFTQFGLSDVDTSGRLTLTPGLGFNGAIINADVADVIIRTLKTHARSKVISSPRLLVNDNATGTLASISESPVQSVNASDTVATTSFAGFVEAGTTITLTPRISQGDHLLLEYDFALNAFTGEGNGNLPPPRQTNSIRSTVTIPDGHTIIVGGLTRSDHSRSRSAVPWLGDIPILGEAFGSRNHTDAKTTLFVFIRPVILRDDQFRDLKYLSERELVRAEQPSNFPSSSTMLIR